MFSFAECSCAVEIAIKPRHYNPPTHHDQDLNLGRIWVQTLSNEVGSSYNHFTKTDQKFLRRSLSLSPSVFTPTEILKWFVLTFILPSKVIFSKWNLWENVLNNFSCYFLVSRFHGKWNIFEKWGYLRETRFFLPFWTDFV